jgi:hypothetical protein
VKANLLDDGIGDTLASDGATIALHEIPWPRELAQRNTREASDVRALGPVSRGLYEPCIRS